MISYILFSYVFLGVIFTVLWMKARDERSFFMNDACGSLKLDWFMFFVWGFMFSPLTLPFGTLALAILYTGKFIYSRFFVKR